MAKRILVIEDNPATSGLIVDALGDFDCEVRPCLDGEDGLRTALEWAPDLIILDMVLGGLNGEDVYRYIRSDPRTAGAAVLICSAHSAASIRRKLGERPPYVLMKPFSVLDMRKTVSALLGGSQPTQPPA